MYYTKYVVYLYRINKTTINNFKKLNFMKLLAAFVVLITFLLAFELVHLLFSFIKYLLTTKK